jgi:hypothetical protein
MSEESSSSMEEKLCQMERGGAELRGEGQPKEKLVEQEKLTKAEAKMQYVQQLERVANLKLALANRKLEKIRVKEDVAEQTQKHMVNFLKRAREKGAEEQREWEDSREIREKMANAAMAAVEETKKIDKWMKHKKCRWWKVEDQGRCRNGSKCKFLHTSWQVTVGDVVARR